VGQKIGMQVKGCTGIRSPGGHRYLQKTEPEPVQGRELGKGMGVMPRYPPSVVLWPCLAAECWA
jgi:hypothetical protein